MYLSIPTEAFVMWSERNFEARAGIISWMVRVRLRFINDRRGERYHASNFSTRNWDCSADIFCRGYLPLIDDTDFIIGAQHDVVKLLRCPTPSDFANVVITALGSVDE